MSTIKNLLIIFLLVTAYYIGTVFAFSHTSKEALTLLNYVSFPKDWRIRGEVEKAQKIYEVKAGGDGPILSADVSGESIRIFKKVKWNPYTHPILKWEWRVLRWPETLGSSVDLYVSIDRDTFGIPTFIKYIWSDNLEKGAQKDGGFFRPTELVIRTDRQGSENWVTEQINVLEALEKDEGNFAAAGLTITNQRKQRFRFGPSYQKVQQQVVCRRGRNLPNDEKDLAEFELIVIKGSSYVEQLKLLRVDYPDLKWNTVEEKGTEQLLKQVWEGENVCTVADSNIVDINRRYFPELEVAFNLTEPQPLAWVLPKNAPDLKRAVESWFSKFNKTGELEVLLERYYGFVDIFDYVDLQVFTRRTQTRLPRYRKLFENAGRKYGFSWPLLAAQGYQESHWDPKAKSPTGVRGIMMLTLNTARSLGVENRMNPEESISAGAKYLSNIRKRLPDEILEPDRSWITLAAYNVGMGHVHDAQTLARKQDKNPYLWKDLKTVFPLLSQKKYYRSLKHGYARGQEPVRYVQRIRDFQDLLERKLSSSESAP